jgi:hypothetical protein
MKLHISVTVLLCLVLISGEAVFAQDAKPSQDVKNWGPLIGHWVNSEQLRATPDGTWEEVASEWEIKMMPGGFFVETPGKMRFADGREVSWVQIWGYDPVNGVAYQHFFNSTGAHGEGPYKIDGTTQKVGGKVTLPDGTVQTTRCRLEFAADYKSSDGSCEQLTAGKWWTFRKIKGKKVN